MYACFLSKCLQHVYNFLIIFFKVCNRQVIVSYKSSEVFTGENVRQKPVLKFKIPLQFLYILQSCFTIGQQVSNKQVSV